MRKPLSMTKEGRAKKRAYLEESKPHRRDLDRVIESLLLLRSGSRVKPFTKEDVPRLEAERDALKAKIADIKSRHGV